MKLIKSLIMMLVSVAFMLSCDKEDVVVKYMDVTPNNIAGEWELVEWNGSSLSEGTYFYIDLIRKDGEYIIYQNFDSMGQLPHIATGRFSIETDIDSVISGNYDFDGGMWSHSYKITKLTENTMTWTAVDDPAFVQLFVRTTIPAEIKE